jgi:hypothetical protein
LRPAVGGAIFCPLEPEQVPKTPVKRPLLIALFGLAGTVAAVVLALFWSPVEETLPIPGVTEPPQFLKPPTPLEPSQIKPQTMGDQPQEAASQPPVFDVVRINPKGDTLIAGRAAPGSEVTLLDGTKEIGKVVTDQRGEWVFVPTGPLAPGARRLKLRSKSVEGVIQESTSMAEMVVPTREATSPTAAGADLGRGNLSIDLVEDEKTGHLSLSGKASAKGLLQIFLDNRLLGRVEADAKGHWVLKAPVTVNDSKMHVFRADELAVEGRVQARVELPYLREELVGEFVRPNVLVVKPGQSLADIAKEFYGNEAAAKAIFDANKNQLRTPDSLFPGQLIFLPTLP